MLLKGEVGGCASNSHGNYIVDDGKIMEKSWNCAFEFLWEPCCVLSNVITVCNVFANKNIGEMISLVHDAFRIIMQGSF